MDPILAVAIYILLWWMAFFAMLPIGAQSFVEADQPTDAGVERAAPMVHNLKKKAWWAAVAAAVLWIGVFVAIQFDVFGVRP
jgi:predicted secreted protein